MIVRPGGLGPAPVYRVLQSPGRASQNNHIGPVRQPVAYPARRALHNRPTEARIRAPELLDICDYHQVGTGSNDACRQLNRDHVI